MSSAGNPLEMTEYRDILDILDEWSESAPNIRLRALSREFGRTETAGGRIRRGTAALWPREAYREAA